LGCDCALLAVAINYMVTNPYLMVIDHWQTLIAGVFVLVRLWQRFG
jgi:hypothetical protein